MKHSISFYLLVVLTLFMAWGYYSLERKLIDAVSLKEITVPLKKIHYNFKWKTCLKQFPDITEHGKAHICYRKDI